MKTLPDRILFFTSGEMGTLCVGISFLFILPAFELWGNARLVIKNA